MELHDRCTLLGCTLGREHTGDHVGPRCPVCTITWVWSGVANTWRRDCAHNLPMPAEPARQPMPAAAPTCDTTVNGRPCGRPAIGRYLNCPGSWRCGEHAIPSEDWTEIAAATPMPAAAPVGPPADVDQLLLDLQAMASEEDERARSAQRRAADLRGMIREINAWRTKTSPSSTVATNGRRGFQP